jgi:hypothetical protein
VNQYPAERKEAILRQMMPPENRPVSALAKENGISEQTLYTWRRNLLTNPSSSGLFRLDNYFPAGELDGDSFSRKQIEADNTIKLGRGWVEFA